MSKNEETIRFCTVFGRPDGSMELRTVSSGACFTSGEETDLIKKIIETGKEKNMPLSRWALWIDDDKHKKTDTYSMVAFEKLVKAYNTSLIWCRRKRRDGGSFYVPTIKFTPKNAPAKTSKSTARLV